MITDNTKITHRDVGILVGRLTFSCFLAIASGGLLQALMSLILAHWLAEFFICWRYGLYTLNNVDRGCYLDKPANRCNILACITFEGSQQTSAVRDVF